MTLAQTYKDQLKRIKKNIQKSFVYFKPNNMRFHEYQRFVFQSTLTPADESTLQALQKPIIEFNITNAPIDRLCGEFSKQQPSIYVSAQDGADIPPELLAFIDGHLRHILYDMNSDNTQYAVYRDQLTGGFSMYKCFTDYEHEMSFNQDIFVKRVYEPTMCGFDPMARDVTKCDAEYYFELFPMSMDEFTEKYPNVDTSQMWFLKDDGGGFSWSYESDGQDYVVVSHYYEKKKKKKRIVQLADGSVMIKDDYDKKIADWSSIEQPPAVVGKPRDTIITTICRYVVVETEVLEYEETEFSRNSLIFVDGNSVVIKRNDSGSYEQFTKPYVYHAKGLQQLTNVAGQMIANDFENMTMHKVMVAKEAIPQEEDYQEAYKNFQVAQVMVYNAFEDNDPNKPLPPPQSIQRVGLPPEVMNTFNNCMQMLQNILGSYDAQLGINQSQLSGVAIVEGATQSNATAMPYVVNNIHALNDVARWCVDMIPKVYLSARSMPVMQKDGSRTYQKINQPGAVSTKFDPKNLHIKIEAGVNFAIAKNQALDQITKLMQVSPEFSAFINSVGLPFLLDNLDFRGVDVMKDAAKQWMQQQQQNQKPDPNMIAAQSAQITAQARMIEAQTNAKESQANLEQQQYETIIKAKAEDTAQQEADTNRLKVMLAAGENRNKLMLDASKVQAEENRTKVETASVIHDSLLKKQDQEHQHLKDIIGMSQDAKQQQFDNEQTEKENESNPVTN